MALHDIVCPLLWVLCACFRIGAMADLQFREVTEARTVQAGTSQQAQLCLSRVATLPKAEGYSALCTSIEALYRQQESSSSSLLAFKEDGERTHASNAALEQRNQELEARLQEMQQRTINREKEWKAAAKKFQAGVASRDVQWQATVSRVETAAAKSLEAKIADRDAHWQATVHRVESEKKAMEQQVSEWQGQKEALEASTSAGTQSRRAILLALTREKQKSHAESKEVQGLLEQIKALQKENAELVQRCVVGNS